MVKRYDELDPATDFRWDWMPQTPRFGKGWVVACSSNPLPMLQTPRLLAPYGCVEQQRHSSSTTSHSAPKLCLMLAVPRETSGAGFGAWYQQLEQHIMSVVENKCPDWFGREAAEVVPSIRDSFYSCMQPDDYDDSMLLFTMHVPTRAGEVLTNFYAADGSLLPSHSSIEKGCEVACQLEFEGLWFANERWGLRWNLQHVKNYGVAATAAAAAAAHATECLMVMTDDDD